MYIVTIDESFIFGTGKYERPGYEIVSPQAEFAVNTAGTFTFTMYPRHPCYDLVDNTKSIVQIKKDGEKEPFFRGRVLSTEMGFYNEKKVVCEGELAFLCDTIQQNYDYSSGNSRKTIHGLLLHFLTVHNEKTGMDNIRSFKIGRVNVTDGDTTNTDNLISAADSTFLNTYDSIQQKLIERYGGYLYVRHEKDGNYIDYLSSPQETCRQKIEFGGNLLNIKKNIEADSLVTAVIPLGKEREDGGEGGSGNRHNIAGWDISRSVTDADDILQVTGKVGTTKTYLNCMYSQSAVEKYGWIEKVLIFDDVVLPATLARYGEAHLKSAGKALTIELNAADLSGANTEIDRFKIGQYVRVNSKPHNLENALYVVSKLSINLSNPAANKICIGTETATITGQVSGANSSASSIGAVGGGIGYDESGSANAALQKAKEYADLKDSATLAKAKEYTDSKAVVYQGENGVKVEGTKISLAHNISAGTVGESTSTTLNFGTSFPVPWIKYNANGQIEQVGNRTVFMPPNPTDNNFTDAEKAKLAKIDANANKYVHPSFSSEPLDLYVFAVDGEGHVYGARKVTKNDITDLGIPSANIDTKNTVGNGTWNDKRLYLAGTEQTSNSKGDFQNSYTNSQCYIGSDNELYSNGKKVASAEQVEALNREQFSITNTTSARYKYVKLGKVNVSKSGSRAIIQLVGRSSYNDIDAGGKVEIYLSCNDAVNTNNCRIGALVYAYGNSTSDLTVTNTWATEVLVVRAEGYSTAEADIYLKFTSGTNFTSYFAVMEKQDTFKWTTNVEFTNTDPTENAVFSYTAAKKLFRDDYLSANKPLKTFVSGKLLYSNSFTASSASSATIDIPNLFTNYSAVVCNAVTTSGKYSVTLPLAYIKSLGTNGFYEAEGLLFYYVDDSTLTVKTGLGQSNPTINSIKIINLY